MQRHLQRLSWIAVRQLVPTDIDTIILPVGTMEAHGANALGTDNLIPETIADGIAERINALVAPTVNYGITKSLYRYNGSLTIEPENFKDYIIDIVDSLADAEFKNIIIMNGHGGNNSSLKEVAVNLHRDLGVNIAVIHWWELCADMTQEFFGHAGGHAGTDETAMVQAIDPALVDEKAYDPELAYHFRPGADIYPVPGSILLYKEGEGLPNFDADQARQYREKVIVAVGDFVEMVLKKWRMFDL